MGKEPFSYPHDLLHPMAHGLLDFVAQRRYSLTVAARGGAFPHTDCPCRVLLDSVFVSLRMDLFLSSSYLPSEVK